MKKFVVVCMLFVATASIFPMVSKSLIKPLMQHAAHASKLSHQNRKFIEYAVPTMHATNFAILTYNAYQDMKTINDDEKFSSSARLAFLSSALSVTAPYLAFAGASPSFLIIYDTEQAFEQVMFAGSIVGNIMAAAMTANSLKHLYQEIKLNNK